MKRQEQGKKRLSKKLKIFLKNMEYKKFNQFGYSGVIRNLASQAYDHLLQYHINDSIMILETAYCYPFLFWNKDNELDISGVIDYDSKKQTGSFLHNTKEGKLFVKNVHSYQLYINSNNTFLPINSIYVPTYQELSDICLAAVIYEDGVFNLKIYHNREIFYSVNNVFECCCIRNSGCQFKNQKGYVRYSILDNWINYKNFIFDLNSSELFCLDDSEEIPSAYYSFAERTKKPKLNYWWQKKRDEVVKHNKINIFLHLDNSKTAQIMSDFLKNAEQTTILDNLFEDDSTLNIKATYDINNKKDIGFIVYCATLNPHIFGYGIMGFSLDELQTGTINSEKEYKNVYKYSKYYLSEMKSIVRELYQKLDKDIVPNELPDTLYEKCISSKSMIDFLENNSSYHFGGLRQLIHGEKDDTEPFKALYDSIYDKLAKENKLAPKWKNEYDLYKTISQLYSDAIYQYHDIWLGKKSLDIFIPSLQLGVEYQGLQHYEAVKFFGGEKKLKEQKLRDIQKKQLCKENGISLIYWKYDVPISPQGVKRRIENTATEYNSNE